MKNGKISFFVAIGFFCFTQIQLLDAAILQ